MIRLRARFDAVIQKFNRVGVLVNFSGINRDLPLLFCVEISGKGCLQRPVNLLFRKYFMTTGRV